MVTKIKFGADPEYFALYMKSGVPCILPPVFFREDLGAKFRENGRHPVFGKYDGSIVHEDGAAFELSVRPSESWRELYDNLAQAREEFSKEVLSKYPDHCLPELHGLPSAVYDVERWSDRGEDFHMANIFGCDADVDVFDMESACDVIDATQHERRYAGGHIHISGVKEISEEPLSAIRSLVVTAGLAATAFSDVPELERERLFLYGKPGKFRIQKYKNGGTGVEYRTPSTRWTINLHLAEQVFKWAEIGIKNLLVDKLYGEIEDEVLAPSINSILSCDQKGAHQILQFIESKI